MTVTVTAAAAGATGGSPAPAPAPSPAPAGSKDYAAQPDTSKPVSSGSSGSSPSYGAGEKVSSNPSSPSEEEYTDDESIVS